MGAAVNRIAVPGLIDLLRVSDATAINAIADDKRMDRRYEARGPLINRLLLGRVRRILQHRGRPLPPVAARVDEGRQAEQQDNERRFADIGSNVARADVAALADYIRGEGGEEAAGPLAQAAVGRLFMPDYRADEASWAAARVLGAAPGNFNPLRLLVWGLTGRVERARALLADRARGNLSLIHGTGIAIHNIVEALKTLRLLYADRHRREALSDEAAVAHALVAPKQVLRQPTTAGASAAGSFGAGTLVLLRLQDANAAEPGYDTAFMAGHWCQCPARAWVPALLAAVWREAKGEAA